MTPPQHKILAAIRVYQAEHDGISPSFSELLAATGMKSRGGLHQLMVELERQGFIRRGFGRDRDITILDADLRSFSTEQLIDELARRQSLDNARSEQAEGQGVVFHDVGATP